jgi:hypothetical protein
MSPHLFPPKKLWLPGADRMTNNISDFLPACQTKNLVNEISLVFAGQIQRHFPSGLGVWASLNKARYTFGKRFDLKSSSDLGWNGSP